MHNARYTNSPKPATLHHMPYYSYSYPCTPVYLYIIYSVQLYFVIRSTNASHITYHHHPLLLSYFYTLLLTQYMQCSSVSKLLNS